MNANALNCLKRKKIHCRFICNVFAGADDETRTRDLILTKDVRYLLCHISDAVLLYYIDQEYAIFLIQKK